MAPGIVSERLLQNRIRVILQSEPELDVPELTQRLRERFREWVHMFHRLSSLTGNLFCSYTNNRSFQYNVKKAVESLAAGGSDAHGTADA